jgi:hypothetical protein
VLHGLRPRGARPACAVLARPSSAGLRNVWRTARARARHCTTAAGLGDGAARRVVGGTAPAHGRQRGIAAHRRGDGGAARWRRASGERGGRGGTAAVRAAGARLGREVGGASEAGCRDARRFKLRRLTGGARSSAISKLKITPKENSSKQIARH